LGRKGKEELKLIIKNFGGMIPKTAPQLLPANNAEWALHCDLSAGSLQGFKSSTTEVPSIGGGLNTVYKYGDTWLKWQQVVNIINAPIYGTEDIVYFTGKDEPQISKTGFIQNGTSYTLGVPAPPNAPTVVVSDPEGDPLDESVTETRAYAFTRVDDYGQESAPSPLSAPEDLIVGQICTLTLGGNYTGTYPNSDNSYLRVYRTVTGTSGTNLHYIGKTDYLTDTEFIDTVPATGIAEVCPSYGWLEPPTDLEGLVSMPNGIGVAYHGKEICFSVPYQLHAWPIGNRQRVDSEVVGLGVVGNSVFIATKTNPYIITGTDPQSMSVEKVETTHPCVSKRGLVDLGYTIVYPSTTGLVAATYGQIPELVTEDFFSPKEWQDLDPESIVAYPLEGGYLFFTSGPTYLFKPREKQLIQINIYGSCGYVDPETGEFYFINSSNLLKWNDGITPFYTWESKTFITPKPVNFGCGCIHTGGTGSVNLTIYADGDIVHEAYITNSTPFRLPSGFVASEYRFKFSGSAPIYEFQIASEMSELATI